MSTFTLTEKTGLQDVDKKIVKNTKCANQGLQQKNP